MPGRVKELIDELIQLRSYRSSPGVSHFVRAHLVMKGIDPDAHDETTPDDPQAIATLEGMIRAFTK